MASWMTSRALSAVLPWGPKPPSTLTDCGISPVWPMTATPAPTIALAASALTGSPPGVWVATSAAQTRASLRNQPMQKLLSRETCLLPYTTGGSPGFALATNASLSSMEAAVVLVRS